MVSHVSADEFARTTDMVRRFSDSYPQREFRFRFTYGGEAGAAVPSWAPPSPEVEPDFNSDKPILGLTTTETPSRGHLVKEDLLKEVYSKLVTDSVQDLINKIDRDFGEKNSSAARGSVGSISEDEDTTTEGATAVERRSFHEDD